MRRPGRIITFYSYKGGTGRSMAVANLGWVLAAARKRVLMMDWDLEASGLHRYFHPFLVDPELSASRGLMDLLIDYADQAIQPPDAEAGEAGEWYRELADLTPYRVAVNFDGFPEGGRLDLVPAGRQGPGYASRLGSFDWDTFYERLGGGSFLEAVKTRLREEYDYVLINSRTGVSDTAGICTVQMPDILVLLFTYNNQSMRGAQAVALSALDMRRKLCAQFPGQPLRIYAVPSRADPFETRKLQLRQNYARRLFDPLLEQVPELERNAYWAGVEIPYSPFLSYEEVLAPLVFNAEDPKFPVAATLRLGAYLTDGEVARYDLPLSPERRQALLASFEQVEEQKPLQAAAAEESPAEALLRSADAALAQLDGERLALARRLLLRLVRLPRPSETPGLKRLRAAVFSLPAGEQELLGHFLQLGVLRLTEDREHGGAVEIADDALLARWRQVNAWAEEDKTALERRDWVQTAISYWQQAGRPDGLLLPASHARQVAPLLDSHPALFSAQEEAFIRASLAQAEGPARAVAAEAAPWRRCWPWPCCWPCGGPKTPSRPSPTGRPRRPCPCSSRLRRPAPATPPSASISPATRTCWSSAWTRRSGTTTAPSTSSPTTWRPISAAPRRIASRAAATRPCASWRRWSPSSPIRRKPTSSWPSSMPSRDAGNRPWICTSAPSPWDPRPSCASAPRRPWPSSSPPPCPPASTCT